MKALAFVAAFLCLSFTDPSVDYRKVFGSDYKWAVNWLQQNDQLIAIYAARYDVPAKELKAIIFPELIRYNRVFDALQIESLKFLYVSEGKDYADFSVGYFQMKPSFAEAVERDADPLFGFRGDIDNEPARRERVRRLTNTAHQLHYLAAFYKICLAKFQCTSSAERVKLFATAYNSGYRLSAGELQVMQTKKHFSGYNYSDVSLYYFVVS